MSTPAGWYPQPDGRERWWDGYQWTEDFAPAASPPVTIPATDDAPAGSPPMNVPPATVTEQQSPEPQAGPGPGPVPVVVKGSNGLAVAGFVLALLGALTSLIPIVNLGGDLLAVLGLVFGVIGLVQSGSRGAGKGLSVAAISLAVVAFAVSAVVNTSAVSTLNTAVKNLPSAPATTAAPATGSAKIGDTLTLKGMDTGSKAEITAMKFVDPATATGGIDTPAAGSRYVAVEFQIQNTGTATYDDSPDNNARVADISGHLFDSTIVSSISSGPLFPATVQLRPGQKAVGYVVFEVPVASKIARVQFTPDSGFADDSGQWLVR